MVIKREYFFDKSQTIDRFNAGEIPCHQIRRAAIIQTGRNEYALTTYFPLAQSGRNYLNLGKGKYRKNENTTVEDMEKILTNEAKTLELIAIQINSNPCENENKTCKYSNSKKG